LTPNSRAFTKSPTTTRWKFTIFPGGYAPKFDDIDRGGGTRSDVSKVFEDKQKKAEIAMQALDSQYRVITGRGDCSAMTAGHRFKFFNHPNDAQNAQYVITSVSHDAEQNPTYETNNEIEQPYGNSFTCIAHGAGAPPFRPMRKTSKPIVQGSQTAFVVGPAGEEIFTDNIGASSNFYWTETEKPTPTFLCVRVVKLGGKSLGNVFIRAGMEDMSISGRAIGSAIIKACYNQARCRIYAADEKRK
jgi:type VI secretion system secreted protein VgrG